MQSYKHIMNYWCDDFFPTAHPSCLNYSPELVEQIRADDSWQCIDCKACTICDGTNDPVGLDFALINLFQLCPVV